MSGHLVAPNLSCIVLAQHYTICMANERRNKLINLLRVVDQLQANASYVSDIRTEGDTTAGSKD